MNLSYEEPKLSPSGLPIVYSIKEITESSRKAFEQLQEELKEYRKIKRPPINITLIHTPYTGNLPVYTLPPSMIIVPKGGNRNRRTQKKHKPT